jgi:hypothetical protein
MSISRFSEYTFLSDPALSAGITSGVRVKLTSNGYITPAGVQDPEIGVTENSNLNAPVASTNPDGSVADNNASKRPIRVRLWNAHGTQEVRSAGAFVRGDKLKRAANGAVAKWVVANDGPAAANAAPVYGIALADADAAGQLVEVLVVPGVTAGSTGAGTGAVNF